MLCGSLLDAGRRDEAWPHIDRLVSLAPMDPAALLVRVRALREEARWIEAIATLQCLVDQHPLMAGLHAEMGSLLLETRRPRDALACFDRAIELDASDPASHMNRAIARQELDLMDDALCGYERALVLDPDHASATLNLGTLLHALGRFDEAIEAFDRTLALSAPRALPHVTALYNKASTLLQRGDYPAAWPLMEARWGVQGPRWRVPQPRWSGGQRVDGATLLLHWEQGLGDTLMLSRFATDVAARGARVILSVQPPLVRLLRQLPGVERIVSLGLLAGTDSAAPPGGLPDFDFHCPLFSLPLALGAQAEAVPHRRGYLRADTQRVRHWRDRLGPRRRLRIGVTWSGHALQRNDHRRSMALATFMRAMPGDCELVSLQPVLRECDRHTLARQPRLRHFGPEIRDMADTAALCELVDLVVSTDTSVAHLAGALGRPVWILLNFAPDWRWHHRGEACAWYDSARLLRQQVAGEWEPVLAQVHEELSDLARRPSVPGL